MEYQEVLISIIIPIYNAENYIDLCLRTIVNQVNDCIEIILVNDGSRDNSEEKCKYYCQNNKNIILINQENLGVSAARNAGLEVAKGKYIGFVDVDDTIEPNTIEVLLNEIKSIDVDLIIWGIKCTQYLKNGNIKKEIITHETKEFTINEFEENLYKYLQNWYFNYTWNKLYKRAIIQNNNLKFNEDMSTSEDLLFNSLYLRMCEKVKIINDILYNYRKISDNSITRKYHEGEYEMQKKAYDELINTLNINEKYNDLNKNILDDYYIKFAYNIIYNVSNKDFPISNKIKNSTLKRIKSDVNLRIRLQENINKNNFNKIFYYTLRINNVLALIALSKAYKIYNYYVHGWYRD